MEIYKISEISLALMNLYIHDIFVHAGLQYSESAGFRGMSCEEDESLFSKLKEIVKNLTNQHDNVLETILLRMASRSEAAIEYGPTSNAGTKENPHFQDRRPNPRSRLPHPRTLLCGT